MTPSRALLRRIPIVASSAAAAAVAGLVFQIWVSREVGPSEYGLFAAVLALLYALSQPFEAYCLATAATRGQGPRVPSRLASFSGSIAIGFVTVGLFAAVASSWTAVPLPWSLVLAGMSVLAVWSILWYLRGLALGAKHESAFVWSRSIEAWARLGLAIVLLSVGWGLTGVLAAVTAGGLLAAALLVRQLRLRPDVLTATPTTSHSDWLVGFLKTAALYLPLALFLRLDVILAPQVLAQIDQGGFAAAGVVGKAIMLYSLGLTPLMFPYFVGVTERVELQRIMRLGIIVPTATLIATSAAFALWGHEIVALAFGAEYAAAAGILPWYLLAMVPLALNVVVVHLLMARCGWKTAVLVWGALGLYWLVLRLSPATVTGLLAGMAGFSLIAGLCGMLIAYRALLSRASADSQTDLRDRYSSRLLPLSSDR